MVLLVGAAHVRVAACEGVKPMGIGEFNIILDATEDVRANAPVLPPDATLGEQYEWLVKYLYTPSGTVPPPPPTEEEWDMPLNPNAPKRTRPIESSDKTPSTKELIEAYEKARKGAQAIKDHRASIKLGTDGGIDRSTLSDRLPEGFHDEGWEHDGNVNTMQLEDGTFVFPDETRFLKSSITVEKLTPIGKAKKVENEDGTASYTFSSKEDMQDAIKYLHENSDLESATKTHIETEVRPVPMPFRSASINRGTKLTYEHYPALANNGDAMDGLDCSFKNASMLSGADEDKIATWFVVECTNGTELHPITKPSDQYYVVASLYMTALEKVLRQPGEPRPPPYMLDEGCVFVASEGREASTNTTLRCAVTRVIQMDPEKVDKDAIIEEGHVLVDAVTVDIDELIVDATTHMDNLGLFQFTPEHVEAFEETLWTVVTSKGVVHAHNETTDVPITEAGELLDAGES